MLNYNKIHSSINFQKTAKRKLAEYMGIADSTLRDRLDRENLTPNDVEKLAAFFGRTIAYYFDKEEKQAETYKEEVENTSALAETPERYDMKECRMCKTLEALVETQKQVIAMQAEKIEILEQSPKKEEHTSRTA